MMSDHVRARAEEVLEKMRDNMEAEQDQLNTERWALVGEFSSQYTRFTQEIERLGCSSSLVGSNFVRPTDEELKDALIHRRAMEAADPALSSQG